MKILFVEEGMPNKSGGFGGSFFSMLENIKLLKDNPIYSFAIITYYEVPIIYDLIDVCQVEYRYVIPFDNLYKNASTPVSKKTSKLRIPFFIKTDLAMYKQLRRVKSYLKLYDILKPNLIWGNDSSSVNFSVFTSAKLKKIPYIQHQRAELKGLSFNYFLVLLFANHFISISKYVKSTMISNYFVRFLFLKKISVIHNFNAKFRKVKKFELKKYTNIRFLFIGRLIPKKNIEEFFEIITFFKKEKPSISFVIEIYGDWGDVTYKQKILGLAERLNLNSYLHVYPFSKKENIFTTTTMNFLFHTTKKEVPEPFGRVLLDAIYYGAIPVTNGYGGAGEVVKNSVNGIVYDLKHIEILCNEIYRILKDSKVYSHTLNSNYKFTHHKFSGEKQLKQYNNLLSNLA